MAICSKNPFIKLIGIINHFISTEDASESANIYRNEIKRKETSKINGYILWFLEWTTLEQTYFELLGHRQSIKISRSNASFIYVCWHLFSGVQKKWSLVKLNKESQEKNKTNFWEKYNIKINIVLDNIFFIKGSASRIKKSK